MPSWGASHSGGGSAGAWGDGSGSWGPRSSHSGGGGRGGGFSSSPPANSDLVPNWSGGAFGGGPAAGQRDVMEIDVESLSNRTKSMQDSFTIQPSNSHRIPFTVLSSRQMIERSADTGRVPPVPFGPVTVCDALKQRLMDPRVFAMTMRLRDVRLGDIPFEIELPRGAEPATIFACIHHPSAGFISDVAVSFSLHDVGPDGKPFFGSQWKPGTYKTLSHTATMVGGVPSTSHGCLLRMDVDPGVAEAYQVNGVMIRIVFRRGVNAPLYRFIGALTVIPANALDDANTQGVKRLIAHLAHTLPQEVVLQILDFLLPRASASGDNQPWMETELHDPATQQFSLWAAANSTNNRKLGAAATGFGCSSSSSEVKPAATGGWGNPVSAPKWQPRTNPQFSGFGNNPANNSKEEAGVSSEVPKQPVVPRPSDPLMLALPCLKSPRIASYVSAPEVLAVPKWCLGPQRQRDAIVGTPLPDGTNFFTAPRYKMLLSALAATEDGLAMRYTGSVSMCPQNATHSNTLKEFFGDCCEESDFFGYELHDATNGHMTTIALPLCEVEGPLLLLHNCCSEDVPTSVSGLPPSLRQASTVEIDGEPLMTLSNVAGNVSCNWLLPKDTANGSLQLKFAVTGPRALSLRFLTPRCWKRLVGDAFPAPPTFLEPGKPVIAVLPPAVIYPLAGVNPRTFNPNLTLTATALFSDKSVGKPVAGILGHAFTAAELLGGRSVGEMEGVTVRMEDLDMQMMTTVNGQSTLPLFGLCGFRAQTCITRTLFDDRQKDDGFKTVVHLLGHCETESYADNVQLGTSSTEQITWGCDDGVVRNLDFDPTTAVNAVKKSATVVTFDESKARVNNNGGGGFGGPPSVAPATTPYECLLVEARALAGPSIESRPLRIKDLVVFIANKDGLEQKIEGLLGLSS